MNTNEKIKLFFNSIISKEPKPENTLSIGRPNMKTIFPEKKTTFNQLYQNTQKFKK